MVEVSEEKFEELRQFFKNHEEDRKYPNCESDREIIWCENAARKRFSEKFFFFG